MRPAQSCRDGLEGARALESPGPCSLLKSGSSRSPELRLPMDCVPCIAAAAFRHLSTCGVNLHGPTLFIELIAAHTWTAYAAYPLRHTHAMHQPVVAQLIRMTPGIGTSCAVQLLHRDSQKSPGYSVDMPRRTVPPNCPRESRPGHQACMLMITLTSTSSVLPIFPKAVS